MVITPCFKLIPPVGVCNFQKEKVERKFILAEGKKIKEGYDEYPDQFSGFPDTLRYRDRQCNSVPHSYRDHCSRHGGQAVLRTQRKPSCCWQLFYLIIGYILTIIYNSINLDILYSHWLNFKGVFIQYRKVCPFEGC